MATAASVYLFLFLLLEWPSYAANLMHKGSTVQADAHGVAAEGEVKLDLSLEPYQADKWATEKKKKRPPLVQSAVTIPAEGLSGIGFGGVGRGGEGGGMKIDAIFEQDRVEQWEGYKKKPPSSSQARPTALMKGGKENSNFTVSSHIGNPFGSTGSNSTIDTTVLKLHRSMQLACVIFLLMVLASSVYHAPRSYGCGVSAIDVEKVITSDVTVFEGGHHPY